MDALLPEKHRPAQLTRISIKDERYPPLLRFSTHKPPEQLYVRGNVEALSHPHPVAFVGTRKATSYGATAVHLLVGPIARGGASIISGLALGTDAACHEAALEVGGLTVAVLPGGIDDVSITPSSHLKLAHRILAAGGALITEMPPGMPTPRFAFPRRNRIIAGMSRATVVVEAARKSGALITAQYAIDDNRDVYCVPGPITSQQSHGTNGWLLDGARPLTTPEQLLADIGLVTFSAARPSDFKEATLLDCIEAAPKTVDALVDETGFTLQDVLTITTALTLKNLVTEQHGFFIKN